MARNDFTQAGALKRAHEGAPLIARHDMYYNGQLLKAGDSVVLAGLKWDAQLIENGQLVDAEAWQELARKEARRVWSENIYTPAKRRLSAAEADVLLMEQRLEAAKQALADAKAEVKAAAATLADAEQAEPK